MAKTKTKTLRTKTPVAVIRRGGKFYMRYRDVSGVRRMKFAGESEETAKAAAAAVAAQIADGVEDVVANVATPGAVTMKFSQLCQMYLPVLKLTMRPATMAVLATQVSAFGTFVEEELDDKSIELITRADVDVFLAAESERGCSSSYLSRIAWALGRIWRGAVERGVTDENPFTKRNFSRISKLEVPFLEAAELDKLLALVKPQHHRDFCTVLRWTGLRSGEALGLIWSDLDIDGPRPYVMVTRQKAERALLKTTAAKRQIKLLPPVVEILKRRRAERPEGTGRVFHENQTGYNILLSLHAACAAYKLKNENGEAITLRLHDLRHLYASHLVQAGVPMSTVAALLGHSDGGVLVGRRYGRWAPTDAGDRAMDKLMGLPATAAV